jgi:hypothetical protein
MAMRSRPGSGAAPEKLESLADSIGVERRAVPREEVEKGFVNLRGQTFPIRNWASNSLLMIECDIGLHPDDQLTVHCSLPIGEQDLTFECQGYVVRADHGEVALLLSDIGKITMLRIEEYLAKL